MEVPPEIVKKANPLWEDFATARFLEKPPHVAKVHMIVNMIWSFGEKSQKIDVYEVDDMMMRRRVTNETVRNKIIRRGMWDIAGCPWWYPNGLQKRTNKRQKMLPLWVHLRGVPMSMYLWEGPSFITSAAGVPDHLHLDTIPCTDFEVAKVFVNADLSKELRRQITYNIQGEETIVEFSYPWLPPKCATCGKWGYYEKSCILNEIEEA